MLCDYAVGTGHIFGGEAFERTWLLNLTETKLRTIMNYENNFGERKWKKIVWLKTIFIGKASLFV